MSLQGGIQDYLGAAEETAAPNPRKSGPTHALRVVLITLWLVLSGASSQISFYATGQDMAGYPMFLLYFCNGCYGLGYFVILGITVLVATYGSSSSSSSSGGGGRGGGQTDTRLPYEGTKSPLLESHSSARDSGAPGVYEQVVGSRYEQVMFVLIGVCTGLSLEMQQYANGKVNVDLQTVLYQLYLPSTAICSMLYLRTKLSPFNVLGAAGVFCSIVLVACGGPAADSGSAVVSSPPPCNQTLAWLLHNCTEASCYSCYEGFCASDQPVVAPSCVPSPPPQCGPSLLGWNPQFNGTAPKLNGTIASRISHAKKMCDDYSKCRGFALNSTSTHDNTILFFGATPNFTQSAVPSSNFTTFWKEIEEGKPFRQVWSIVYGLGTVPLGMACVLQEQLFEARPQTSVIKMSAWSTTYGVVFNLVTFPLSMAPGLVYGGEDDSAVFPHGASFSELMQHQSDSWSCFFGRNVTTTCDTNDGTLSVSSLPVGCDPGAAKAVMIYVLSYGINVYCCMALVKEMSAVFCVVFGAMVVPASTIGSSIASIMKLYNAGSPEPFTWNVGMGAALCVASLVVFKGDLFMERFRRNPYM